MTARTEQLDQHDVISDLTSASNVMLTNATADGSLQSHPMTPLEVTDDADVWFIINRTSELAKTLNAQPHVNLSVSKLGNWLSVAGHVEFVNEPGKVQQLWNKEIGAYFAGGPHDPEVGLLLFVSTSAQHWGAEGRAAAALLDIVKARATGTQPGGETGTVEL